MCVWCIRVFIRPRESVSACDYTRARDKRRAEHSRGPVFWASIGAASTCVILAVVWPAALWVWGGVALHSSRLRHRLLFATVPRPSGLRCRWTRRTASSAAPPQLGITRTAPHAPPPALQRAARWVVALKRVAGRLRCMWCRRQREAARRRTAPAEAATRLLSCRWKIGTRGWNYFLPSWLGLTLISSPHQMAIFIARDSPSALSLSVLFSLSLSLVLVLAPTSSFCSSWGFDELCTASWFYRVRVALLSWPSGRLLHFSTAAAGSSAFPGNRK